MDIRLSFALVSILGVWLSSADGNKERIVTMSGTEMYGRCCIESCLEDSNEADCKKWKDSIIRANDQQAELTEERVAKIEKNCRQISELRKQAEQNREAQLQKIRENLNQKFQTKKKTLIDELNADIARVTNECQSQSEKTTGETSTPINTATTGSSAPVTHEMPRTEKTTAETSPQTATTETAQPPVGTISEVVTATEEISPQKATTAQPPTGTISQVAMATTKTPPRSSSAEIGTMTNDPTQPLTTELSHATTRTPEKSVQEATTEIETSTVSVGATTDQVTLLTTELWHTTTTSPVTTSIDETTTETEASTVADRVHPKNCQNVSQENAKVWNVTGGLFDVYPESSSSSIEVYCDLTTDGGGWTVFQRRMDGSVDFYRNWTEYVKGFGTGDKETWLGLENLYQLTKDGEYELRVDLADWEGNTVKAEFGVFDISSSSDNYRLTVGQYTGNAGDSLDYHNGYQFSTYDEVHHACGDRNCGVERKAGWWFKCCSHANLNGLFYVGGEYTSNDTDGIVWYDWKTRWRYSLKYTEMKFRKKN